MAKYRFDQVARECRTTFKGDKNGMPIVGLEHLVPNEMLVRDFEVDTENTFTKSFKQGQILFGRRRAYQQKAGVAQFDGICSGDITVIEAIPGKIEPNLLPFIVQNEQFFEHAVQGSAGSLSPRVKWEHLASYEIELPTMEKQRVLADKLWTAYRLKESYKKLLAATDEMVKSQFIEMFGSVDDNPKSYDIKKVGDFAECFAGATPSTKISSYWDNGNIPWMSSGEVHKARVQDTDAKITQQGYDGCSTKMVPIHSIVIALAGQGKTRGMVAINDIELCTNQSLCAIVPNEEVNYEYLFHNLRGRYKELRSMSGDVDGRGGLNLKHIQSIKVIVPPMSEQKQFVSIAEQADKSKFVGFKSQFIEMFGKGNWEQKCLGEIGTFKRGGGFQKSDYVEHGIPCIHYGQIHTKFGPFIYSHITEISTDLEPKTKFASKGDLIIAITSEDTEGSCKSTAWLGDYPVAVGGHAAIFHHCMNPLYMSFFFKSTLFNYAKMEYIHGTKVFEVKPDDIAKILVPCPPMSLQKQFSVIARQADKSKLLHRKSIKYSKYSL